MDYELAKKLKDAGFPQEVKDGKKIEGEDCPDCGYHMYYAPTLEELVESLRTNFQSLQLVINATVSGMDWTSSGFSKVDGKFHTVIGDDCVEAVARLWIKLNEK